MNKPAANPGAGKDEHFMGLALELAHRGMGLTSPNPPVGAVIVKNGKLLSEGFHRAAGLPHAEVEAIRRLRRETGAKAASQLKGATIYITLEPCSTQGRTPPCTDAIIEAGFRRVVFGAKDPNPKHRGRSSRLLRGEGIQVDSGVLERDCLHVIRMFRKFIQLKLPYVIAKSALTLDGRIVPVNGVSRWITGPAARRDVQKLRARVDAIIVGGETVRRDNPRLTLRGEFARRARPQPWRVVLTRTGRLPRKSHIFNDKHKDRTLVFQGKSLPQVLRELALKEVVSVLLETGGDLMGQAFKQQLVDEVQFYVAPTIGGGDARAISGGGFSCDLRDLEITPIGEDLRVIAFPRYPNKTRKKSR